MDSIADRISLTDRYNAGARLRPAPDAAGPVAGARRGVRQLLAALLAALALLMPAAESRAVDAGTAGGFEGTLFRETCSTGQVLVGYWTRTGSRLGGVGANCVALSPQGTWQGNVIPSAFSRVPRPQSLNDTNINCPRDYVVQELRVLLDNTVRTGTGGVVFSIGIKCMSPNASRTPIVPPSMDNAPASVSSAQIPCGPGQVASGIFGFVADGPFVTRVGLSCEPLQLAATQPGGQQRNVALTVDVYNTAGGGGRVVGQLQVGAAVTILTCRGDDWCQVTGATVPGGTGWVWSGPSYNALGR